MVFTSENSLRQLLTWPKKNVWQVLILRKYSQKTVWFWHRRTSFWYLFVIWQSVHETTAATLQRMSGYGHGWMERDSTIKYPSAEVFASSISQSLWDETCDFISQNFRCLLIEQNQLSHAHSRQEEELQRQIWQRYLFSSHRCLFGWFLHQLKMCIFYVLIRWQIDTVRLQNCPVYFRHINKKYCFLFLFLGRKGVQKDPNFSW